MNLFLSNTKKVLLSVYVILLPPLLIAQSADTTTQEIQDIRSRELKKTSFTLIPSDYMVQYAGGIGLVSLGAGWEYGKSNRWETDLMVGYVPKYDTDRSKLTFTLRQTYTPWNIVVRDGLGYHPLRTGAYLSTTLGKQFWFSEPEKYPSSYYNFSTKLRLNIFVGQDFSYQIKSKTSYFEGIKFYYDLHTTDLYLISRVQNKYLRFDDYVGLALGVKLQIRRQ